MIQAVQAYKLDNSDIGVIIADFHKLVKDGVAPPSLTVAETLAAESDDSEDTAELPEIDTDAGTEPTAEAVANE
jgi:hypothetical protein